MMFYSHSRTHVFQQVIRRARVLPVRLLTDERSETSLDD